MAPPLLTRVRIKNFRSIASCDVELGPLMFIVGRNGSGKSNFLDALRLVAEVVSGELAHVLEDRGGLRAARREPRQPGGAIEISLTAAALKDVLSAEYSVTFQPPGPRGVGEILKEHACVGGRPDTIERSGGNYEASDGNRGVLQTDLSALRAVAGSGGVGHLVKFLSGMFFYSFNPERMREPHKVDGWSGLRRDGGNISAAVGVMGDQSPQALARVTEYLSHILPGLERVRRQGIGDYEILQFERDGASFESSQISDGTMRALGVLVAALGNPESQVVGIEEPELALHPGAFGVLQDALREASESRQILVTTQSPELLNDPDLQPEQLLAVQWDAGQTRIGPVSEAEASMLRDKLMTAGELLHQGDLEPA